MKYRLIKVRQIGDASPYHFSLIREDGSTVQNLGDQEALTLLTAPDVFKKFKTMFIENPIGLSDEVLEKVNNYIEKEMLNVVQTSEDIRGL